MSNTYHSNTYHAEAASLGCMVLDGGLIKESRLHQEHFKDTRHKLIIGAMRAVNDQDKPVDMISIVTELGDGLAQAGGVGYLSQLADSVPSTETYRHYESMVLEAYCIQEATRRALEFSKSPSQDGIGELLDELTKIQERASIGKTRTKRDILFDVLDRLHEEQGEMTGVPSGLVELDAMTGGWQKQDLIIIAARPSMGKTAFALGLGATNCKKGGVTSIFSLEMGDTQLMQRLLSSEGNIDGHKWRNPYKMFSSHDFYKVTHAIARVENWDLEIHDDPGMTVTDIRAKVREIKRKYPDQEHLIIIDYLQLIRSSGRKSGENRQQEVSEISRALKGIAREFDVPVIALSQLSRGVESRQDKRPMMSDIRESGSIEQDADIIAFLYRDDYYDKESENQNIIEIIVAKQRNGPTGTVESAFIKEYGKFVNLDRRYDEREAM